jgi:hypothetical protein
MEHGCTQTRNQTQSETLHLSQQSIDRINLIDIQGTLGIKDKFPKSKRILSHKSERGITPNDIVNKFRKRILGTSNFEKKKNFENKKNKRLIHDNKDFYALEVVNIKATLNIEEDKKTGEGGKTFSFFPKDKNMFFLTNLKEDKKTLFGINPQDKIGNETNYNKYIFKDFANSNPKEYDINLNYNTFYGFFKNKREKEDNRFNSKEIREKDKKIKEINKYERKIQTEFLHKLSFPKRENMGIALNNFNMNKGLYKINENRGLIISQEKLRDLSKEKNELEKANYNNDEYKEDSLNINKEKINNKKNFKNFLDKKNKKIHEIDKNSRNKSQKKNFNSKNNLNEIKEKQENKKIKEKSESKFKKGYYNNNFEEEDNDINENTIKDLMLQKEKDKDKEKIQNLIKKEKENYNKKEKENYNKKEKENYNTDEKIFYTFNINQTSNVHFLRMLKINDKHLKLSLSKKGKLVPKSAVNNNFHITKEIIKNKFENNYKNNNNNYNINNIYKKCKTIIEIPNDENHENNNNENKDNNNNKKIISKGRKESKNSIFVKNIPDKDNKDNKDNNNNNNYNYNYNTTESDMMNLSKNFFNSPSLNFNMISLERKNDNNKEYFDNFKEKDDRDNYPDAYINDNKDINALGNDVTNKSNENDIENFEIEKKFIKKELHLNTLQTEEFKYSEKILKYNDNDNDNNNHLENVDNKYKNIIINDNYNFDDSYSNTNNENENDNDNHYKNRYFKSNKKTNLNINIENNELDL